MVFHGSRLVFHGFSWFFMVFYGFTSFFMIFHGFSWFLMVPGWFFMGFHDFLLSFMAPGWFFMVFHGFPWFQVGFSWFFIDFHGFSWFLMVPGWFFMVFHGFSCFLWFLVGFLGFSPKCTHPNCILAKQSILGPPPGGRHRTQWVKRCEVPKMRTTYGMQSSFSEICEHGGNTVY